MGEEKYVGVKEASWRISDISGRTTRDKTTGVKIATSNGGATTDAYENAIKQKTHTPFSYPLYNSIHPLLASDAQSPPTPSRLVHLTHQVFVVSVDQQTTIVHIFPKKNVVFPFRVFPIVVSNRLCATFIFFLFFVTFLFFEKLANAISIASFSVFCH